MSQIISKQTASKFFKYNAIKARRHPSVQQAEHLKWNPVPGFTSWYDTNVKNNVHYVDTINLQNVITGNVTRIELTPNFPQEVPLGLPSGQSIRDIVQNFKTAGKLL